MGESLGRYTLLRRVAAGGMAEIWKAKAVGPAGFTKTVAIKRILPHLVEETEFIQMFIEEAKLAAELVHPNVIQVFDFGQLGENDYFIAMEYVAGPSLARLLKRVGDRQGTFPAICALYVIMESAKGLGHAHSKTDETGTPLGIVHRDVSPQNVLLWYTGDVKIGDFGIAKAAGAVTRTQEGQVRGKLSYMSPEQANGRKDIDGRSDLFSLGVCMFELLTGRRLFPSTLTTVEAYGRVAGFRGLDLEDLALVPQPFRDLVSKSLRAEPADRFQSGAAMEQAIAAMLGSKGIANGKQMLSTLITSLFAEERTLEMTPTNVNVPMPPPEPAVVGGFSGPAPLGAAPFAGSETVKSPIVPIDMNRPPLRPSPTPAPTSGLTLKSAKLPVQPQISTAEAEPPPVVGTVPEKRTSPAMIVAIFGGGAMVIAAIGFAAKMMGVGASPAAATATPTPFAMASTAPTNSFGAGSNPDATATPVATSTPIATSIATSTRVAVVPTATPITQPQPTVQPTKVAVVAPKGMGSLSVTSRPWVQVWVDNKLVKPETPLTGHKLPAGRHWVRLINAGQGFDETRPINVPVDGEVAIQVDVKAKTVTIR